MNRENSATQYRGRTYISICIMEEFYCADAFLGGGPGDQSILPGNGIYVRRG
jgi:hypothetical protein